MKGIRNHDMSSTSALLCHHFILLFCGKDDISEEMLRVRAGAFYQTYTHNSYEITQGNEDGG